MAKKADPRIKTAWLDKHGLNDRQRAFVLAYLKTKIAGQAAKEAGYAHPDRQGPRLLSNVVLRAAVDEGMAQIEAAAQVDAEKVLIEWWGTYNADPVAMSRVERIACRYCHGSDHEYQWRTSREYREALTQAAEKISGGDAGMFDVVMNHEITDSRIPLDAGGYGYTTKARPHPDCPECDGAGWERVYIADTRNLTAEAKRLFDGAKVNAKGQIEINQLDRANALENVARHLGMFKDKGDEAAADLVAAAFKGMQRGMTTVPVVPDDPARRMARMNRHVATTITYETARNEEP